MNDKEMKTAVEWLENEIADNLKSIILTNDHALMEKIFTQAKAMEKQQLISFGYAQIDYIDAEIGDLIYSKVPEEIYSETFSKD